MRAGSVLGVVVPLGAVSLMFLAKRISTTNGKPLNNSFNSPCGSARDVAVRIGACAASVFEIVEGKVLEAKSDDDLKSVCERFAYEERCIRAVTKDCLARMALQKSLISAVAASIKRYRGQECKSMETRSKYYEPIKCAYRMGAEMSSLNRNSTAAAQAVRDLDVTAEAKVLKMCCMLSWLDKEYNSRYTKACPQAATAIVGIIDAMTTDAKQTVCKTPRCSPSDNEIITKAKFKQEPSINLIVPLMQILLELNTDA